MKSLLLAGAMFAVIAPAAQAATVTYGNRASFTAALNTSVTDDYANPGYQFIQSDAAMSAVLGETDYMSTGFNNLNIIAGGAYCAGCNGSFKLSFGSTSVTSGNGVFGVGFDVTYNDPNLPYTAFVTFGDGSTANYGLALAQFGQAQFFGFTSDRQIASINFGLPNAGTTQAGSFQIDNLTIGNVGGAVPEPSAWALMILGFGAAGAVMRTRSRALRFA